MRIIPFIITVVVTMGLIVTLSKPIGSIPPLGSFLSPQTGFWQNAEPVNAHANIDLNFPQLKDKVQVYFDDRMVPHVFAQNDEDLYFVQGYLHAKFRLWQMEFQTYAAAGRLCEVLGPGPNNDYLNYDRNMRRVGMQFGARHSLDSMENDPVSKSIVDAYTSGVNAYINNLSADELPLEYRLLNYVPEHWNNYKTALFLKYMSYSLTGSENDFELTNVRNVLSREDFEILYPTMQDSLDPIIPKGEVFSAPAIRPQMPVSSDSIYFKWNTFADINATPVDKPDKDNGSNNWAVSGAKTKSGRPILCNDPHLDLNLPSLWFEMQLHTPQYNVYGVSFPGSPAVIIGFNDSCSWGVTNAQRDVKDYYNIKFKDETKEQYFFNGNWVNSDLHIDTIKIKGALPFYDTVAYTVFGPVQYDNSFTGKKRTTPNNSFAVKWQAHEGSNELKTFYLLNRTKNMGDYREAIKNFHCPGQNFVFASKSGDIAIWQQGEFPAKWRRQGDFIMPGVDSSYLWQGTIEQSENPHLENPERGFVSSANQMAADTSYPYYLGGHFPIYRGIMINRYLRQMSGITIDDMKKMQTDNFNVFAETALPLLMANVDESTLSIEEKKYLDILRGWNLRGDAVEKAPAIFQLWFDNLELEVWDDDLEVANKPVKVPDEATLVHCLNMSNFKFADNIKTNQVETVRDVVTAAFKKTVPVVSLADQKANLNWGKYKDGGIRHLLRLAPLSRFHLMTGGGENMINATKQFHGPSWRMIVELTDKTEAWGIYPGGQSGNPGSQYYDNFIDKWSEGKYDKLWVMDAGEAKDKRVLFTMNFN
ncbi:MULTISPECIES: penicillin acylase family protein [Niastella]|uniref:Penicillin acylase family protein n=1 Tax=Niastella soli TaxID=2821487 RepID=A0ABS3YYS2_9BACT|nr:penicillin acylase family protein [Niastella soli]MBO9202301.1 penicillin acylase family protein [Niastella soli]